jgi:ATP-dependent exoDNAse (exonuclease V) beta subunit
VLQALRHFSSPEITEDIHIADAICEKLQIDRAELGSRSKFLLTDLIHHYADLSISTIDSFVSRLVHQFAYDLNLPFQFRVELNNDELLEQAVDELLDETGKENTALTKVLTQFILHQTEKEASRRIENELMKVGRTLLKNELKPVFESLQPITEDAYIEFQQFLQKQLKSFENKCADIGKECLAFLEERGIDIGDFKGGTRSSLAKTFVALQSADKVKANPFNTEMIKFITGGDWTGKKPKPSIAQYQHEIEQALHPKLEKLFEEYQDYVMYQLLAENVYQQATINLLSQTFERVKAELNVVSLSSFNELVHQLVQTETAPFIYERFGDRYHHYMVDEFQDTSTIQWNNLIPLYTNSLASSYFNMVVGDAKQSIYRWRGGDSEQFIKLGKAPSEANNAVEREHLSGLHRYYKEELLDTNHRSYREIVDFNNRFFEQAASLLTPDGQAVYKEVKQQVNPKKVGGKVSIQFKPSKEDDKDWQRSRMIDLLNDIHLGKQFNLSDVCVLCRKNDELKTTASWIEEAGFEVFTLESLTLERSSSIRLIRSIIQWYLDPESPSFAIEVITQLLELDLIPEQHSNHAIFAEIAKEPACLINWIHEELGFSLPDRFSDELSIYTFYQSICLSIPIPYDAYLSELGNFILTYAQQYGDNLAHFLKYFDQKKGKVSIQSQPSINAVQLMTIHKSKGLQFPVVIMPFTNITEHPHMDPRWISNELTELENLPHSLVPMSKKTLETKFASVYQGEKNRQELDTLNMLYVGFTRPKHQLYAFIDSWAKNGVGKHFLNLLEQFEEYDAENKTLTIGAGDAGSLQNVEHEETVIPKYERSHWKERIHLSTSRLRTLEAKEHEEQLLGQYFHAYMQYVIVADKLTSANRWLQTQPIETNMMQQIQNAALRVVQHPEIATYFKPKQANWRETNLWSNGRLLRADRIVETDSQLVVLDYKTAKPSKSHQDQIRQYGNALYRQSNKPVELLLIYIFPEVTIRSVNFQPDLFG